MAGVALLALLTLVVSLRFVATAQTGSADLIFINGRIWTGDAAKAWATALAIKGNRIIAVGSDAEAKRRADHHTQTINLAGRFVMPGINDAHIHFLGGSLGLFEVDLFGAASLAEMQKRVARYAAENPDQAWITGSGWEYSNLPDNRLPTREDLDAIIKDRPVFLRAYDGHTAWANTKALELAGVTAASTFTGYGEIVIDAQTKQPTGVLKEGAMSLVNRVLPKPTREHKLAALRRGLALAARLGITSIQNAHGNDDDLSLYAELLQNGELTVRTSIAYSVHPRTTAADINRIAGIARRHQSAMLRVGAVKIMADGVIETHTAAMLAPYSDQPTVSGSPVYTQAQLNTLVALADRASLQIYIHAIGDGAVRMALDAFAHARHINGARDSRFRIEHIETVAAADIPRFAKLGVIASMEPIHADPGTNGVWLPAVGEERAQRAFAWRALELADVRLLFSSDWPAAISVDPMRGLHNAVNRRTTDGQPADGWIPAQRVSVETALRAYTAAGAYASFEEKTKGKLAPGMLADVIVLSADPFKVAPLDLHKCRVEMTIFDGRIIYNIAQ